MTDEQNATQGSGQLEPTHNVGRTDVDPNTNTNSVGQSGTTTPGGQNNQNNQNNQNQGNQNQGNTNQGNTNQGGDQQRQTIQPTQGSPGSATH